MISYCSTESTATDDDGDDNTVATAVRNQHITPTTLFNYATPNEKAGILLQVLKSYVFASTAFKRLLVWLTSYTPINHRTTVRRMRPGLDYTVGNYNHCKRGVGDTNVCEDNTTSSPTHTLSIVYTMVDEGQADMCTHVWNTPQYEDSNLQSTVSTTDSTSVSCTTTNCENPMAVTTEADEEMQFTATLQLYADCDDDEIESIGGTDTAVDSTVSHSTCKDDDDDDNNSDSSSSENDDGEQMYKDTGAPSQESKHPRQLCNVQWDTMSKRELWRSDDCGGFLAYVRNNTSTLDNDQAQSYSEDEDADIVSLSATANSLSIVYQQPTMLQFVRYINAHAPGSRWDICMDVECVEDTQSNDSV
uniref:PKHD-type hydroxylase TPA1 n=1 Tax=Lygus hesperus TaxID=30085 RepID=A0A0A9WP28_LYGHE